MKGRVLVVDDERRQRDILQMILESEGYETTAAANGRQALQAARTQPFDVVLTDLKMPDMSGIELLSDLLGSQPGLCVTLMTAHGTIDSAVEAMKKGAFDYLTKPLEKDEVLVVLRRAMERSHIVRENRMLKEQLRDLYRDVHPDVAASYLKRWCTSALRSKIPGFRNLVTRIRRHFDGIVAAIQLGLSNSRLEGINAKTRVIQRRGYGHPTPESLMSMIYLCLAGIQIPLPTQR